jgi:hypothetical protein
VRLTYVLAALQLTVASREGGVTSTMGLKVAEAAALRPKRAAAVQLPIKLSGDQWKVVPISGVKSLESVIERAEKKGQKVFYKRQFEDKTVYTWVSG